MKSQAELFELYVDNSADAADIARMPLAELTKQITELDEDWKRDATEEELAEDDQTSEEIAELIQAEAERMVAEDDQGHRDRRDSMSW